ncbi:CidA/LrgA family protein [Neobacillus sp. LXY-4]|uniref:CidA/LrgA family protein n=1 Tax=Neobacillus sp. LXY-4 TaxID=3379826 RepID=UPI003EE0284E
MKLRWFLQLFILVGFLLLGYGMVTFFHIPLPGSVVGMILLFVSLLTGIIKLEWIDEASTFQLKHLTLLLIPPIVSLFISSKVLDVLQWPVLIIIIVSSISCLLATAIPVEWYEKLKRRNAK